jgi:hypothetical protein
MAGTFMFGIPVDYGYGTTGVPFLIQEFQKMLLISCTCFVWKFSPDLQANGTACLSVKPGRNTRRPNQND